MDTFTIPKKKQECLSDAQPYDREDILKVVKNSFIDRAYAFSKRWDVDQVKLCHNQNLTKLYMSRKSQLKGHTERYAFQLLTSDQKCSISEIVEKGVRVGKRASEKATKFPVVLGKLSLGVQLVRYLDVLLKAAELLDYAKTHIVVYKIAVAKTHSVKLCKPRDALEPDPKHNCHISSTKVLPSDSLVKQLTHSLIYVYDYNEEALPRKRPRHVMPVAVLSLDRVLEQNVPYEKDPLIGAVMAVLSKHIPTSLNKSSDEEWCLNNPTCKQVKPVDSCKGVNNNNVKTPDSRCCNGFSRSNDKSPLIETQLQQDQEGSFSTSPTQEHTSPVSQEKSEASLKENQLLNCSLLCGHYIYPSPEKMVDDLVQNERASNVSDAQESTRSASAALEALTKTVRSGGSRDTDQSKSCAPKDKTLVPHPKSKDIPAEKQKSKTDSCVVRKDERSTVSSVQPKNNKVMEKQVKRAPPSVAKRHPSGTVPSETAKSVKQQTCTNVPMDNLLEFGKKLSSKSGKALKLSEKPKGASSGEKDNYLSRVVLPPKRDEVGGTEKTKACEASVTKNGAVGLFERLKMLSAAVAQNQAVTLDTNRQAKKVDLSRRRSDSVALKTQKTLKHGELNRRHSVDTDSGRSWNDFLKHGRCENSNAKTSATITKDGKTNSSHQLDNTSRPRSTSTVLSLNTHTDKLASKNNQHLDKTLNGLHKTINKDNKRDPNEKRVEDRMKDGCKRSSSSVTKKFKSSKHEKSTVLTKDNKKIGDGAVTLKPRQKTLQNDDEFVQKLKKMLQKDKSLPKELKETSSNSRGAPVENSTDHETSSCNIQSPVKWTSQKVIANLAKRTTVSPRKPDHTSSAARVRSKNPNAMDYSSVGHGQFCVPKDCMSFNTLSQVGVPASETKADSEVSSDVSMLKESRGSLSKSAGHNRRKKFRSSEGIWKDKQKQRSIFWRLKDNTHHEIPSSLSSPKRSPGPTYRRFCPSSMKKCAEADPDFFKRRLFATALQRALFQTDQSTSEPDQSSSEPDEPSPEPHQPSPELDQPVSDPDQPASESDEPDALRSYSWTTVDEHDEKLSDQKPVVLLHRLSKQTIREWRRKKLKALTAAKENEIQQPLSTGPATESCDEMNVSESPRIASQRHSSDLLGSGSTQVSYYHMGSTESCEVNSTLVHSESTSGCLEKSMGHSNADSHASVESENWDTQPILISSDSDTSGDSRVSPDIFNSHVSADDVEMDVGRAVSPVLYVIAKKASSESNNLNNTALHNATTMEATFEAEKDVTSEHAETSAHDPHSQDGSISPDVFSDPSLSCGVELVTVQPPVHNSSNTMSVSSLASTNSSASGTSICSAQSKVSIDNSVAIVVNDSHDVPSNGRHSVESESLPPMTLYEDSLGVLEAEKSTATCNIRGTSLESDPAGAELTPSKVHFMNLIEDSLGLLEAEKSTATRYVQDTSLESGPARGQEASNGRHSVESESLPSLNNPKPSVPTRPTQKSQHSIGAESAPSEVHCMTLYEDSLGVLEAQKSTATSNIPGTSLESDPAGAELTPSKVHSMNLIEDSLGLLEAEKSTAICNVQDTSLESDPAGGEVEACCHNSADKSNERNADIEPRSLEDEEVSAAFVMASPTIQVSESREETLTASYSESVDGQSTDGEDEGEHRLVIDFPPSSVASNSVNTSDQCVQMAMTSVTQEVGNFSESATCNQAPRLQENTGSGSQSEVDRPPSNLTASCKTIAAPMVKQEPVDTGYEKEASVNRETMTSRVVTRTVRLETNVRVMSPEMYTTDMSVFNIAASVEENERPLQDEPNENCVAPRTVAPNRSESAMLPEIPTEDVSIFSMAVPAQDKERLSQGKENENRVVSRTVTPDRNVGVGTPTVFNRTAPAEAENECPTQGKQKENHVPPRPVRAEANERTILIETPTEHMSVFNTAAPVEAANKYPPQNEPRDNHDAPRTGATDRNESAMSPETTQDMSVFNIAAPSKDDGHPARDAVSQGFCSSFSDYFQICLSQRKKYPTVNKMLLDLANTLNIDEKVANFEQLVTEAVARHQMPLLVIMPLMHEFTQCSNKPASPEPTTTDTAKCGEENTKETPEKRQRCESSDSDQSRMPIKKRRVMSQDNEKVTKVAPQPTEKRKRAKPASPRKPNYVSGSMAEDVRYQPRCDMVSPPPLICLEETLPQNAPLQIQRVPNVMYCKPTAQHGGSAYAQYQRSIPCVPEKQPMSAQQSYYRGEPPRALSPVLGLQPFNRQQVQQQQIQQQQIQQHWQQQQQRQRAQQQEYQQRQQQRQQKCQYQQQYRQQQQQRHFHVNNVVPQKVLRQQRSSSPPRLQHWPPVQQQVQPSHQHWSRHSEMTPHYRYNHDDTYPNQRPFTPPPESDDAVHSHPFPTPPPAHQQNVSMYERVVEAPPYAPAHQQQWPATSRHHYQVTRPY